VLMSPTRGTMEVAMLPGLGRTFTTYHLAMEDSAYQGVTGLKEPRAAAE
jgi:hypothetical protein